MANEGECSWIAAAQVTNEDGIVDAHCHVILRQTPHTTHLQSCQEGQTRKVNK